MENIPALRVLRGSGQGRRLLLAKDRLVIGREDDVDFGFHDQKLSREHAEIVHRDGGWHIRDMESRNGTSLNGQPLGKEAEVLRPGDRITLGLVELEFVPEDAPPTSRLRLLDGPLAGREFALDGRKVILGRSSEGTEIALNDQAASKQNTELEYRHEAWWVRDLDSRNGTDCDGARLPAGSAVRLHSGARLRVGASVIEFLDHRIEDRIGTALLGYQLMSRIAAGPCGVIFRGRGEAGEVAVKLLDPVLAADPREALRFINGARAQARIQHPNVARVLAADVVDGQPLLIAELALGGSLGDRIVKANAPLPVEQVTGWLRDAARGLQAAEEHGLLHRSLRPGNLLVDGEGAVAVADFGTGATYLASAPHGGPPTHYLAPEEVAGSEIDSRANQFSLGCIAYHALTAKAPFNAVDREATAWARHEQTLPAIQTLNPAVGSDLAKVCARLLGRTPDSRYPGWAEAAGDLDALVRGVMPTTGLLPSGQSALSSSLPPRPATVALSSSSAPATAVRTSQPMTVPPIAIKGLIALAVLLITVGFVLPALSRANARREQVPSTSPPPPPPVVTPDQRSSREESPSERILRQQEVEDRATLAALDDSPAPALVVPEARTSGGRPPMLRPQIVALCALGGPGDQYIRQVGFDDRLAWGKGSGFTISIDSTSGAVTVDGNIATDDQEAWDWHFPRDPLSRQELQDPRNGYTYALTTLQVHPILQQPLLTSTAGWKLWGWTHRQITEEHRAVRGGPLMADSRGYDLWLMPEGKLGVLCWTDGANSVLTRDPRDLAKSNQAVEGPGVWRATAGGMASLFLLIDGQDGSPLSGTFVKSQVTNRVVDSWGRVYLPRPQEGASALAEAAEQAGGGLFVLGPDLRQSELNIRLGGGPAAGGQEGFAVLALHDNLLVLGGTTNTAKPPAIPGLQAQPGGGQDAFIAVLKLW